MHNSDSMAAAVHAARASPPRLQTLHPVLAPPPPLAMTHPLPLPPPGMDKKHFLPLGCPRSQPPPLPFPPPPPPITTAPSSSYEEEEFEDVDEDDMSDLEEELEELNAYRNRQRQPDMTRQLLAFADMVNADIQKFFGRKKGDEDSCDVYEDKWVVMKSGRELYYADLLRMAQGDFGDSKSSKASQKSTQLKHKDIETLADNRHSFSGKADSSLGLGPLKDLFDHGLKGGKVKNSSLQLHHNAAKRQRTETESSVSETVPMRVRRFPESFWREPGLSGVVGTSSGVDQPVVTSSVLQSLGSAKLPDFSDLMESWHGEQAQQLQQHQLHPLHQMQHQHLQHRAAATDAFTSASADSAKKPRRL